MVIFYHIGVILYLTWFKNGPNSVGKIMLNEGSPVLNLILQPHVILYAFKVYSHTNLTL